MNNQPVRETGPFFRRQNLAQIALDLGRILLARQTQAARQPPAMGIDGYTGNTESVAAYDICGLAADAGERRQLFHRRWNFAVELFDQLLGAAFERLGLGAKQTESAYERFDIGDGRLPKRPRRRIALKKRRRDFVHRRVGALGREYDRDQEFESISVGQRTLDVGIRRGQTSGDGAGSHAFFGEGLALAPIGLRSPRRRRTPFSCRV